MAEITAKLVKELREKSGAGVMDAKKALVEVEGDIEKAIELLREKGMAKAAKKADRVAAEGLTGVYVNGNVAAVVEVNAETDFVAKNAQFVELVNETAKVIAEGKPAKMCIRDSYKSQATEFLIEGDTLIPPFIALEGLGENVAKQVVAAREEGEFLSKTELRKRGGLSSTLVEKLDEMGILGNMPEDNQLSLFDDFF